MDFIITGLPRSKTAWLSVFFSQPGICECRHEVLAEFGPKAALQMHSQKLNLFQGCSDSGILMYYEQFLEAYPAAKWIHIDRDFEEVRASAIKADIPIENLEYCKSVQQDFLELMEGSERLYRLPFNFEELDLIEASNFIGIEWNAKHYELLKRFNIQMAQRHVDFLTFLNVQELMSQ